MSFINKFRGGVMGVAGIISTAVASVATLNVSSALNVLQVALTGTASVATLNVASTVTAQQLAGASTWAGITTLNSGDATIVVSTVLVASGQSIHATLMNVGSIAMDVTIQSIVDNTSFNITTNAAVASGTQDVSYIIIT